MSQLRAGLLSLIGALAVAGLYVLAAMVASALSPMLDGNAIIWPGVGVLVAILLLAPPRRFPLVIFGTAMGSIGFSLFFGRTTGRALVLACADVMEVLTVWWCLRGRGQPLPNFETRADVPRFALAILIAALVALAIVCLVAPPSTALVALSWVMADVLGMCLVTPTILLAVSAWRAWRAGCPPATAIREASLWLALVVILTTAVFAQNVYPLLFLPPVALLAATYRLGPVGAAGGTLLVGMIAATATALHRGPMMLLHGAPASIALFLQFYLTVLMATALPIAAALATRNRLMREVAESNRLLMLAERTAQMGHMRLHVATGRMIWSPETYRLYSVDPAETPSMDRMVASYHRDDRDRVRHAIAEALASTADSARDFLFEARLCHPDGSIRHVRTRGHIGPAIEGDDRELFAAMQDVSERVHAAEVLEKARRIAEAAADTDHLTGVASRRRALRLLSAMMAEARETGRPLAVALFDIDHFKAVNDAHGHLVGDQVLQTVAGAAMRMLRPGDVVGRLGGEEFVLLLPDADDILATATADRVRVAIGTASGAGVAGQPPVTVSIGVACMAGDLSTSLLLSRADSALYDAKRAGRNRMRLAP